MQPLHWTFTHNPDETDVAELRRRLAASNVAASSISDERWLACFVRNGSGEMVGGAVGRAWGEVLELRYLWVHDSLRGRGVGSDLLRRLEQAGAAAGCKTIITDTFSFQAPEFYRQQGYEVMAIVEGFPGAVTKVYLRKTV